jgi:hypothetical protein
MAEMWLMLFGLLGGLLAIGVIRRELPPARMRWVIRRAVPFDPSVAESTFVRVTGTVRVHERTVVAPLSGRECVAARSRLRLHRRNNNRVYEVFATVPFSVVRDGGGDVLVDAAYIQLATRPVDVKRVALERKQSLLADHRLNTGEAGRAWFEEVVVEAGRRVSVAGTLILEPGGPAAGERAFRAAPAVAPRLTGDMKHPVVLGGPVDSPNG